MTHSKVAQQGCNSAMIVRSLNSSNMESQNIDINNKTTKNCQKTTISIEMPHNIIIRMISLFFLVIEVSIYIRVSSLLNNADQGNSRSTILCIVYNKYTFF